MATAWTPLLLALLASHGPEQEPPTDLFNGKDLTGWDGDTAYWSVEDGCLVGRSTPEHPLPRSVYLFSEVEASDFILEFEYRIEGGNSGVQYRSRRLAEGEVAGYQADIEDGPNYTGILYESDGRGILAQRGQHLHCLPDGTRLVEQVFGTPEGLQALVRSGDWNRYRIVAQGAHLVHEINGVRMVEVLDEDPDHARAQGRFALQLHQGPPMEVRFRDLQLRRLGAEESVELAPAAPSTTTGPEPPRAHWIWSAAQADDLERPWFRLDFDLSAPATLTAGQISCDNGFRAWVDGQEIAAGESWWAPSEVNAGLSLEAGPHHLILEAWNEGGPAGLAAHLELTLEDGRTQDLLTEPSWRSTPDPPKGWPATSMASLDALTWLPVHSFGEVGAAGLAWGTTMAPRKATPVDQFELPPGFEATLLQSASPSQGSWASMTFGPDGELYLSPERGPLLRVTFPDGHEGLPLLTRLDTPVHSAQGLLHTAGALYANVAGGIGEEGDGGLHRLRDLDGDGRFEEHVHLAKYGPPSEHGAHGIVLGPDGMLYVVIGNHTRLPDAIAPTSPYRHSAEDVLLPRIWDPRGHAHGMFAPAGVVLRTDLEATTWEVVAGGMRNAYDLAFSPEGELFTYDSDMEWDLGTPWYRSPRVVHVVPGSETGWRSGSAKWPDAYPDSLPAVLETGPASPVGITFGTGSRFPQAWQDRLFLGDWAYGRIVAVDLIEDGAGFRGRAVPFLSGKPLNVTDLEIGPDGALWFITGGRGTQSGLYRVEYTAEDLPAPSREPAPLSAALRLRRQLESDVLPMEQVLQALGSPDRLLRHAARSHLERRDTLPWTDLWASMDSSLPLGEMLLAATRVGGPELREAVRARLLVGTFSPEDEAMAWLQLRTAMLLRTRGGLGEQISPDPAMAQLFGQAFPTGHPALDREVARFLVAVEAPGLPALLLDRLHQATYAEERMHYALLLRLVKQDWSEEQRWTYLAWLREAQGLPGGMSLRGFLQAIEAEALTTLEPATRDRLLATLPPPPSRAELGQPVPRSFQRAWTVGEALTALVEAPAIPLSEERRARGAALFRDLSCIQCHRWDGVGGSLGPDLSAVGRRFGQRDLLEAILEPDKAVSDQYALVPMPPGLLDTADARDLVDLIRFLEQGP